MDSFTGPAAHVAAIYNAAWWVRHYRRGARVTSGALVEARRQAILRLGLTVREAFNASDDFEALLLAVFEGLSPKDDPPF